MKKNHIDGIGDLFERTKAVDDHDKRLKIMLNPD
jgi:hypothetical protein